MKLINRLKQITLVASGAIFLLGGQALSAEPSPKTALTQNNDKTSIVAKVNGAPITARELERAKKLMLSAQPGINVPPERKQEFEKYLLNQLISAELLYQGGSKLELKDIDSQVEQKIAQTQKRFKSQQEFEKAIQNMDLNMAEMRDYTRRDLIIANFIQSKLTAKISVSEDESKKFYDQNVDKFKRAESVRASHILIGIDSKASAEEKKKAREKAEQLRKQIADGAEFAAVAKANSTCPSSKMGGDLGYFGKGQMVKPFEDAAFGMQVGEVSSVVETQFGYHIIKLLEKKNAETIPYAEVKSWIEKHIKDLKINGAVNAYLNNAKKEAKIEMMI